MANYPFLPLYYNDISRSCSTWSDEEFGCYIRLLIEQWDKGIIPPEHERIKRLVTSFEKTWPLLKDKFIERNGGLINERMEHIRFEIQVFSKKQSDNAKKGWEKRKLESESIAPETPKEKPAFKSIDIAAREESFKETLRPFIGEHSKQMIIEFFNYWSEKTQGGKKMRFELQKTWEVKKRLATWAKNEQNKINTNGKQTRKSGHDLDEADAIATEILRQHAENRKHGTGDNVE